MDVRPPGAAPRRLNAQRSRVQTGPPGRSSAAGRRGPGRGLLVAGGVQPAVVAGPEAQAAARPRVAALLARVDAVGRAAEDVQVAGEGVVRAVCTCRRTCPWAERRRGPAERRGPSAATAAVAAAAAERVLIFIRSTIGSRRPGVPPQTFRRLAAQPARRYGPAMSATIPAATQQISYADLYARWEQGNWRRPRSTSARTASTGTSG
jgi:hypothetical protein